MHDIHVTDIVSKICLEIAIYYYPVPKAHSGPCQTNFGIN